MFASGSAGMPLTQDFKVTPGWQTITLDLGKFPGFNPELFMGFAITAGPGAGVFDYDIDSVALRK